MKSYTEQVIEKAIEGGWKPIHKMEALHTINYSEWGRPSVGFWYKNGNGDSWGIGEIFMDTSFWRALGKAMGWKENWTHNDEEWDLLTYEELMERRPSIKCIHMVEHLFAGGTIDSYCKELIENV